MAVFVGSTGPGFGRSLDGRAEIVRQVVRDFEVGGWKAWEKVRANKGAPGVDGCSIEEFEKDLKNNLYKVWNRMSSGSYFPPPVLAVEIPKPHGGGPNSGGAHGGGSGRANSGGARLEEKVEPIFHSDSYGYRPGRSALDAVGGADVGVGNTTG